MNRFLMTLSALLATTVVMVSSAHAGPPTDYLKAQVQGVRTVLKTPVKAGSPEAAALDVKLMGIVDPVMDFEGLSQRALRKHWPTLSAAQKTVFTETFRQLVFRSYLDRVRSADEAYSIIYEDEEKVGKASEVTAIAKTKNAEIELVFVMAANPKKAGAMVAQDVRIDEVSLVENYREQFTRIIVKEKFEGLIKKMTTKLNKLGGPVKLEAAATTPAAPGSAAAPSAPAMKAAPATK